MKVYGPWKATLKGLPNNHVFNTGLNGFYLVKFDNVWMPEKFQVLDFSSDLAHHIQALDFLTVQDFYCNLVLGDLVKSD